MKTRLNVITIILAIFVCLFFCVPTLADEVCGRYDTIPVMQGEYIVQNNVWGASHVWVTSTPQCVTVYDTRLPRFRVSRSAHRGTRVASYPSIFKGCHWSQCSANSGMPVLISEIASAPFTWKVTPARSGQNNIAAEAWFSPQRDATQGYANGGELMIWIDSKGMTPDGARIGTATIGGATWDLWFDKPNKDRNWNYIAYRRDGLTEVSLDLNDFIKDAISRGYLMTDWYLHDLEAGTEIIRGGEGFSTDAFSFSPVFWSWSEPAGKLMGTPNYGYRLSPLYDEATAETPQTWTELDEAPGFMGVTFDQITPISGVRFYSYDQAPYWNHITRYRILGQHDNDTWVEVVPSNTPGGHLPGWQEIRFPEASYQAIKVEYSSVSTDNAPRVGELQFATPTQHTAASIAGSLEKSSINQ
jgi:hypothetical protein